MEKPHKVISVEIESLAPYPANPRRHPEAQIAALGRMIQTFGFNVPVLIDKDRVVVAGHGRILAARSIGMTHVPAIVISHLTDDALQAFRIAENRSSLIGGAGWDQALLNQELELIRERAGDITMEDVGFSDDDLRLLSDDLTRLRLESLGEEPPPDEDDGESNEAPADEDLVTFTVMMPHADRETLYQAIRSAKARHGFDRSGDALLLICKEWAG